MTSLMFYLVEKELKKNKKYISVKEYINREDLEKDFIDYNDNIFDFLFKKKSINQIIDDHECFRVIHEIYGDCLIVFYKKKVEEDYCI